MTNEEEIRLAALMLAEKTNPQYVSAQDIIEVARAFERYIVGKR